LGKGRENGTGPQGKTTAAKAKLLWNFFSLNVASAKSQKPFAHTKNEHIK